MNWTKIANHRSLILAKVSNTFSNVCNFAHSADFAGKLALNLRKGKAALVITFAIAAILRLWALGSLPPGLYRDEAFNGLDALGILRGDLSLYFAANNGREPMFFYLLAASVAALGRTPLALRLPAALASLLSVPALYLMARALWGRRVGLLSAAVLAVTLWPVHLAHVSFRAGLLPLLLALTTWQAARACSLPCHSEAPPELVEGRSEESQAGEGSQLVGRSSLVVRHPTSEGSQRHWLAAGVFYGLSLYTYLAARFTPLVLALFALYAWIAFLRHDPEARRRALQGVLTFITAAFFTLLPLLIFTLFHWDIVMGRLGQASVLNPAINQGDLPGTLLGNTLKALGMFFIRGDRIYRHNVPWRPVFDPVLGAFFALGVILAVWRLKRDASAALALLWTLVMLLPTILAEDSPHFLRAAGVLPVIAVFPALGLEAMWKWLEREYTLALVSSSSSSSSPPTPLSAGERGTRPARVRGYAPLLVIGVLVIGLASTTYDYFIRYPQDPKTAYWFDSAGVSIAEEVQHTLEIGGRVTIEQRLWNDWPNLRFMVSEDDIALLESDQAPEPVPGLALWLAWPYDNWIRLWPALAQHAQIEAREGALHQGDKDPEPRVAYLSFRATPYTTLPRPHAQFESGIQLLEASAVPVDDRLCVRLVWYADSFGYAQDKSAPVQPFIVFVHLLQNGQRIAQGDSAPANGYYPAQAWRPGNVIVDEHWIDLSELSIEVRDKVKTEGQVMIGLYIPGADRRLNVLDAGGRPIADSIRLDIERK